MKDTTTETISVEFMTCDEHFDGKALPIAVVERFGGQKYSSGVARITKKWLVIVCNEVGTMKFGRDEGYTAGAFTRGHGMPSRIHNLEQLNAFAESHGGTWDSGWKPKRDK